MIFYLCMLSLHIEHILENTKCLILLIWLLVPVINVLVHYRSWLLLAGWLVGWLVTCLRTFSSLRTFEIGSYCITQEALDLWGFHLLLLRSELQTCSDYSCLTDFSANFLLFFLWLISLQIFLLFFVKMIAGWTPRDAHIIWSRLTVIWMSFNLHVCSRNKNNNKVVILSMTKCHSALCIVILNI